MLIIQKYIAPVLVALALIFGGLQGLAQYGVTPTTLAAFIPVVVAAILGYIVKLLPSGWQGATKTGVNLLGAIAAALVPYLFNGGHFTQAQFYAAGLAVLNAVLMELGVQIRTDPVETPERSAVPTAMPVTALAATGLPPIGHGVTPPATTPKKAAKPAS